MITIHLQNGTFATKKANDFDASVRVLTRATNVLRDMPLAAIVEVLHTFGRNIMRNRELAALPGAGYIALWLSRENLLELIEVNYRGAQFHSYTPGPTGYRICLEPRGIISHFVAGNIPHLTFFSLMLGLLSKNASLVKVPGEHVSYMLQLLRALGAVRARSGGRTYSGRDLLKTIVVASFSSKQVAAAEGFSLAADARIVWGGAEAVESIKGLPERAHTETIIFGPKYSFGVFDAASVTSRDFEQLLAKAASDVVLFNQMACSSPHVYFFEKSRFPLRRIGEMLARALETMPERLKRSRTSPELGMRILNERARYLLDPKLDIIAPKHMGWSIFMNTDVALEEPIQGGSIYLKEVRSLAEVVPLITRKIQAVSVAIRSPRARVQFAEEIASRGVDRVVPHGSLHDFTLPWDGVPALSRLVRWTILKD